jgi:HD-like signal output (HDOD) protein/prolyl-tRNA editing enzyme YbaK/EbsC (Cys-tRNA(Pro) deacylase)
MSVPAAVASIFKQITANKAELAKDVARIEEVAATAVTPGAAIRTVLLADARGRVQVVIAESALLDLDSLNQHLDRHLRALPQADVRVLKQRNIWYDIPVLPDLTGSNVIADNGILALDEVFVPSIEKGLYLKMQRGLLEALMGQFTGMNIAIDIASIEVNRSEPGQDISQINRALGSFTKFRICRRLEDTLEMPPLPETAQRIIKLRTDPNAGIAELSDLVETDPSLSAQVVSWASSSFYAAPGKIRSVHDAIVRVLGFDLVMNLAMGLALGKTLKIPDDSPDGFGSYWEQAVWMATVSSALSTAMPKTERPEFGLIYLSGLLHNFGYLVLAHVFPPHFSLINRYAEVNEHCDAELCEQQLLGITREQIGSQLMYTWNMPEEIVIALRQQKNPEYQDDYSAYSLLLFVATQFLREQKIAHGPAQPVPQFVWEALQLTEEGARQVFDEMKSMADEINSLAGNLKDAARI